MTALAQDVIDRLQNIVSAPRGAQESYLSNVLNNLPSEEFEDVVNNRLGLVTPAKVREVALANFDSMDKFPNPGDSMISIDEVADALIRESDRDKMAVFLFIWLHFEAIRSASDDFSGVDKAFDYALTRKDFENYVG